MFIGHFAVGLAGKKYAPGASLASLWLAAIFADVLWPILLAVGAENVRIVPRNTPFKQLDFVNYPWSHSLLMLIIWGSLFAAFYRKQPGGKRIGIVLGALVVSHWFLDWMVHWPDMPLWPYGPKFGLGLWESVPATMVLESVMLAVGAMMYVNATWSRDGRGTWGFWTVIMLLFVSYVSDSFNTATPRSVGVVWRTALIATAIMIALAFWIERHRYARIDAVGVPQRRRVRVDLR